MHFYMLIKHFYNSAYTEIQLAYTLAFSFILNLTLNLFFKPKSKILEYHDALI